MKRPTRRLLIAFVSVSILLCGSMAFLLIPEIVRYSEHEQYPTAAEFYAAIRAYITPGQEREKAVQSIMMNVTPWYHGTCDYSSPNNQVMHINDVFFYGPRNRDYVRVVLVRSTPIEGKMVVSRIYTLENYALYEVKDCLPPELTNSFMSTLSPK